MSKIVSIGTALPPYRHRQEDILEFMLEMYQPPEKDIRKIRLLYENCGIESRYSAIADYSVSPENYTFYPKVPRASSFPTLETRMDWYRRHATSLSIPAIRDCLRNQVDEKELTCLITVSCTGMSAPGLDISIIRELQLPLNIQHTSVNYMGCYAALHALKMADAICRADHGARVLIVCTELCTLHFQEEYTMDHITSSLLFADGAAAVLVTGDAWPGKGLALSRFYSEIALNGESHMTWELSGKGFLMHLSTLIPHLVKENMRPLLRRALRAAGVEEKSITRWAIHPGGKKILSNVGHSLDLSEGQLAPSYHVLKNYGNMSSPTILFVLKEIMEQLNGSRERVFAAAFGPGLTMETLILESS
ncbi:putative naringenin-chalcone synthase [Anseongella ginsenosidimutans]|uniref:Putative naringenin-chalcone synthase n=1 Tax=Anseongella ginsenosidimutans TaxID=496056 RepID=A0A4R3KSM9_9SPHI|nr:type III polyketide synthase [Anseongella ginsenosidimutans]QEC52855.1 type III polyketide synthase [Anseongella ginsenosidimutans]TCS87243.1 putative naringenin-chalcone synthase [Anseongella ginsenosidimutans]